MTSEEEEESSEEAAASAEEEVEASGSATDDMPRTAAAAEREAGTNAWVVPANRRADAAAAMDMDNLIVLDIFVWSAVDWEVSRVGS